MKNVLKIIGIILSVIVLIIIIFIVIFFIRYQNMSNKITKDYNSITDVDLSKVKDGVYSGSYSKFLVSVDLAVTVKEHKITNIKINKQSSGPGYEGREVINRIIEQQSLKVDAKTGATGSSSIIIIAVDRALNK